MTKGLPLPLHMVYGLKTYKIKEYCVLHYFNLQHVDQSSHPVLEPHRSIFHQVYNQALESLSRILS
ncbi:hypothetical protein Hanom_Chr09g00820601 [Helianthus anomalus]